MENLHARGVTARSFPKTFCKLRIILKCVVACLARHTNEKILMTSPIANKILRIGALMGIALFGTAATASAQFMDIVVKAKNLVQPPMPLPNANCELLSSGDAFFVYTGAWASVSSNSKLRPLLSYSNEWGRFTQYDQGELGVGGSVVYSHVFKNPRLAFTAGLSCQASLDDNRSMINELYANFDLFMFDVRMGWECYTPIETNNYLSVGSYLMSNNATPVLRGWIGILDYWSPIREFGDRSAKDYYDLFQLRGGVCFGRVDDEANPRFTDDIFLHEKFVYARIGQWKFKPYLGLYHSVMMGGTLPDNTKIPIDFMASFFGKAGSPEVFGNGRFRGETTNAAGGHQGMWDLGVDFDLKPISGKFYYQRPFADARADGLFSHGIKDFTAGLQLTFKEQPYLSDIVVEFVRTDWQGGIGLPDPCVPTNEGGSLLLWPGDVTESNFESIAAKFVPEDVAAWEAQSGQKLCFDNYYDFAKAMYNGGQGYGGRTLYLVNGFYKQGWTRKGLSMGNTLMHTSETVRRYAPTGTMKHEAIFSNVRVRALNVGVGGEIIEDKLNYNFRTTISRNYGNYREQFAGDGNVSWEPLPNYYFADPKTELYFKLGADYTVFSNKDNSLTAHGVLALDCGDLYSSFAVRLGLSYSFGGDNR